jgi:c-di-GMP-binding flagellar brake protein YcgR
MHWEEKRQHKRAYMRIPVQCRGKNFWQYVEARDISAGGMFVATEQIEPVATKLEVMFELNAEKKEFVRAEAAVVWTRPKTVKDEKTNIQPAGMGLKFNNIVPITAKEYIDQLVKKIDQIDSPGKQL